MKIRFLEDRHVKDGPGNIVASFLKDEVHDLVYGSAMHWINRGAAVEHVEEDAVPLDPSAQAASGESPASGQAKPSSASPGGQASPKPTAAKSGAPAPKAAAASSPSTPPSGAAPSPTSTMAPTPTGGAPKDSTPPEAPSESDGSSQS